MYTRKGYPVSVEYMVIGVTALLSEKVKNEFLGMIPGRRLGTTEEVSHAVAFLAAENAGYITGSYIPVDGGMI